MSGLLLGALLSAASEPTCARVLGLGSDVYDLDIQTATTSVASIWPVPHAFVKAVIHRESGFQPRALSSAGAVGLMQVMPANARRLGVSPAQLWAPATNILAGTRLLAVLLRHYQGDVISTLIAYNAGPRRPFAPVPENGETPDYVRGVLASWRALRRCELFTHFAMRETEDTLMGVIHGEEASCEVLVNGRGSSACRARATQPPPSKQGASVPG